MGQPGEFDTFVSGGDPLAGRGGDWEEEVAIVFDSFADEGG